MNLAELITQKMADHEWTYRQLGERAQRVLREQGRDANPPNWHQLANRPLKRFPEPRTVPILARALGVPLKDVTDAILHSLGLVEMTDDNDDRCTCGHPNESMVVISAEDLTPEQVQHMRRTALSVVDALRNAYLGDRDDGQSPAS